MLEKSLYVWFPQSRRWVPATWAGAGKLAVDEGFEVAYGIMPPGRPGRSCAHLPPLWRIHAWMDFVDAVTTRPDGRHRLSSSNPHN
jgi:hypothetical protein